MLMTLFINDLQLMINRCKTSCEALVRRLVCHQVLTNLQSHVLI